VGRSSVGAVFEACTSQTRRAGATRCQIAVFFHSRQAATASHHHHFCCDNAPAAPGPPAGWARVGRTHAVYRGTVGQARSPGGVPAGGKPAHAADGGCRARRCANQSSTRPIEERRDASAGQQDADGPRVPAHGHAGGWQQHQRGAQPAVPRGNAPQQCSGGVC
jgi:hypothetical protein